MLDVKPRTLNVPILNFFLAITCKFCANRHKREKYISIFPVPTYYIIQFLMIDSDIEDLSDYKGSKAYSYFKQGWPSNISYHSLGSSKYCLLKKDCLISERLRDFS